MKYKTLFNKPLICGIVADVNQGKSMLIYNILEELRQEGNFNLYTYGLRADLKNSVSIHSVEELEKVKNSFIVVDEFFNLFDLDNRKSKKTIENTLRLINHNNNILLLCGVGENFKKFISSKLDILFYKQVSYSDLINGSRVKKIIQEYKGVEAGSSLLSMDKNKALLFDGLHYKVIEVKYLKQYDTKLNNEPIIKDVKKKKKNKK